MMFWVTPLTADAAALAAEAGTWVVPPPLLDPAGGGGTLAAGAA